MATVQSDIFKPTKYGGKYTVTLIPGMYPPKPQTTTIFELFLASNWLLVYFSYFSFPLFPCSLCPEAPLRLTASLLL